MAYAPLDWLQAYDAAGNNTYGEEPSQQIINNIINGPETSADYQKALAAGIVGPGGSVNWDKAPKYAGGDLSGNAMYNSVGGRYGFGGQHSNQPTASLTGNYINDPNYGMQAVVQKRAPNSPEMNMLRAGAIAMATGPMAAAFAPSIAGATGMSSQFSQLLAKLLVGQGSNLAQGGSFNPGQMLGSLAGGYSGIPFGSALGGMAGGFAGGMLGRRL